MASTFTTIIDGFPVECNSPEDVLRMIRAAKDTTITRGPGRPPLNGKSKRELKQTKELKSTLALLQALSRKPKGISAEEIVIALGLKGTRGVGGGLVTVKRVLREKGVQPDEVFSMESFGTERRWIPGDGLAQTIKELEAATNEPRG